MKSPEFAQALESSRACGVSCSSLLSGAAGCCTAFCTALDGTFKVIIGNLQVTNFTNSIGQIVASQGVEFARMRSLYLHGSLASFRWGDLQLWQTVLAKDRNHAWPLDRQTGLSNRAIGSRRLNRFHFRPSASAGWQTNGDGKTSTPDTQHTPKRSL
jgi:hypothetical protein